MCLVSQHNFDGEGRQESGEVWCGHNYHLERQGGGDGAWDRSSGVKSARYHAKRQDRKGSVCHVQKGDRVMWLQGETIRVVFACAIM